MVHRLKSLLEKYDRPGPRYTSYPPATHFHCGVGAAEYRDALARLGAGEPLSLYVHVPFCERRCTYCGCYTVPTRDRSLSRAYLSSCLAELSLVRASLTAPVRLCAVHLGGGTPTYLLPAEIEDLFVRIRETFQLDPAPEIAVEVDPRVTRGEHLDVLRRVGTTRISIGVQDTLQEVQDAIGRHQTRERTVEFFAEVRDKGFRSINLDLVYGLPRQTPETFRVTLRDVVALRPERFAVFGYAHVPWVRPHQKGIAEEDLPQAEERLELYLLAHRELTGAGYRHIGMDHFALPDDDLSRAQQEGRLGRNFMGYTPHRESRILGIGASSIGDLGPGYFQNEKDLSRYSQRVEAGELPVERGFLVSADDVRRRHVVREVLCNLKVDYGEFEARFGVRFEDTFSVETADLEDLAADGLIELRPGGLRVTSVGILFLRNVAMVFDRYLRERPPERPTYSRTV